jgi:di/tricarboxylate transporter
MGLSYIALLGGTITLIGTSTNLIVAGLVTEAIAKGTLPGAKPLALFDSMWIGIPVTAAGILFMIFIGSRILRDSTANTNLSEKRLYRGEFRVEPGSKIEHKTLTQAGLGTTASYAIDSIRRNGTSARPAPDFKLERDDILTFFAPAEVMPSIWATIGLVPVHASPMFSKRHRHQLVELIISDRAPAIGHRISELPLPDSPYQMMLVGISRYGRPPEVPLADLRLEPADAAIVEVDDEFFYENRREVDFLLTKRLDGFQVKRVDRALIAVAITVGMILLAALGLMPMLNAALLATFAMLLTGCLTIPRIWQSLDWQTIVVLGAAIALESAATSSGLSKAGAEFFTRFGGRSPMLALTAVFLGTVLLTNVVTNVAAAALMFSVASSLSTNLGVSFLPFAMILIVGASCTFVNPAAFSTNLMVQVPGGYQFSDYARVGLPLTILVAVITLVLTPIIYGF